MANSDTIKAVFPTACTEALVFADEYETMQEVWEACEKGDWMLVWLGYQSGDEPYGDGRRALIPLVVKVAKLLIPVAANAEKVTEAIDYAEAWGRGDPEKTDEAVAAFMAEVEANEHEDIEGTFIMPMYVITLESASDVGWAIQSAATTYALTDPLTGEATKFDNAKNAEVADIVREFFPEMPLSPLP